MNGKFITIEGIDGSGKSTMSHYIVNKIKERGYDVILTREPGGTDISEMIRKIILDNEIDPKTEVLLFAASRREHLVKKIKPALEKGIFVVCDRFLDSSIAYQSYGRGLDEKKIININDYALNGIKPDVTLYFDVDLERGLERTQKREKNNKLDSQSLEFYGKIKNAYDNLYKKEPNRIKRVDANLEINEVEKELDNLLESLFRKWKI
ncbi:MULTISPECIES: dTMP kinase [unclassified Gemella]|uniref:dTMP kinase n=1 Tax=unclassified Gemella TaxID=2624949 RepID=UPI001073DFE3|nr:MULTISPECIES: dTMP kinase [unclassified Gemella]MBF0710064.1 dTMP kinase [Gemella sp. GL1.1]MBF0746143.1 dTMP kinase [Gemella sp. 19428wG2_WT2a]NYS27408.1 dTMP kinase [Gemella sp. GL1]TFU60431.1 dTMP kinase [Gemella sp. WT2a]